MSTSPQVGHLDDRRALDVADTEHRSGEMDRRLNRAKTVIATAVVAVAAWLLVEALIGVDLKAPAFDGSSRTSDVGALNVLITSLMAALAGWALLAALERFTSRPSRLWAILATVVFLLSLSTPFSGSGTTTANGIWLALLHVTVAVIVIPNFYRSARSSRKS